MDLTPYVAALRDDLAAAGSVGDEATARASTSLAAALEPAVRLTLMNALSDLAAEVSGALPDHSVDLRLHGREVEIVVHGDDATSDGFYAGPSSSPFAGSPAGGGGQQRPGGPGGPSGPGGPGGPGWPGGSEGSGWGGPGGSGPDVGDISRMTLRIVDQIKGQAERAAAAQGMSLNSWVAQAVQGALRGQGGWPGGSGGHGWPGGWSGRDWSGKDWSGGGWSGHGPSGGWSGQGPSGGWSGQGSSGGWSQDPPREGSADGPSGSRTPPEGTSSSSSSSGSVGGEPGEARRDTPTDRRDDDPGDGGVQGWVRG